MHSSLFISLRRRERAAGLLATSAKSLPHYYGSDYLPPTPHNLTRTAAMVVLKSAVLASSHALVEWEETQKRLQASSAETKESDKVDWDAFNRKHLHSFYNILHRGAATEAIKKLFEGLLERVLSIKLFDRVTKLQHKSALRKLAKFNDRGTVAYRMLYTSVWSNAVMYSSMLTYDIILALYEHYGNKYKTLGPTSALAKANKALLWLGKKIAYYSIILVGSASGFSLGFYLSPSVGPQIGPLVGENLAQLVAVELLGRDV
jgi:hypothetical protein